MTINTIYIDSECSSYSAVKSIEKLLNVKGVVVDGAHIVYKDVLSSEDPVERGKTVLYLTKNRGSFIRKCPGTKEYHCCGYQILHIGTFCTMDCSYCILQTYFHPPVLQYFLNHEDLLTELRSLFSESTIARIGTGEFTDSLIWDSFTPLSELLVTEFGQQDVAALELKTKTTNIKCLERLPHNRKTICSWSINTPTVIKIEERKTASLNSRLKAASLCEKWGYPLSFHFDPIFIYDGAEEEYKKVIDMLFASVSYSNIAWISLGTFRFMPGLKSIIERRFPTSSAVYQEFIPGLDGKMRYFKPMRIKVLRSMIDHIRRMAPLVPLYFCMEDDDVWKKTLGGLPQGNDDLASLLDQSAKSICGLSSVIKKE